MYLTCRCWMSTGHEGLTSCCKHSTLQATLRRSRGWRRCSSSPSMQRCGPSVTLRTLTSSICNYSQGEVENIFHVFQDFMEFAGNWGTEVSPNIEFWALGGWVEGGNQQERVRGKRTSHLIFRTVRGGRETTHFPLCIYP